MQEVTDLLKFVYETKNFVCDEQNYEQQYGIAIGSPVSLVIANCYMDGLEEAALKTALAKLDQ